MYVFCLSEQCLQLCLWREELDKGDDVPRQVSDFNVIFSNCLSSNTTKIAPTSASFDSNKYQGAKAISSADLFGDEPVSSQSTPQSRLSQFSGASGVGSSDIFGNGNSSSASYSGYNIR